MAATGSLDFAKITDLKNLGLNGSGIVTGQIEGYMPDPTNPIFAGVSVTLRNNSPDNLVEDHATQVAGIMVGNSINTVTPTEFGIAPGAQHFASPWVGGAVSLDSAANYMSTNPIARVINMSAGDVLGNRNATLSRVIDSYAFASSGAGKTSQLFVIADTNDGWDSTANAPRVNSVGNPDSNYNGLSVGSQGGAPGTRNGTSDWRFLSGFSGQGLDTDNAFNPDIVAPGGQIRSSVANWSNTDGLNGDLTDDNINGQTQIDLSVAIPFFGLRAGELSFQGGGTQGTIADTNGNGVFDLGDLIKAGAGKNFNDNDNDNTVSPGDSFIRTNANDAGDDPDPSVKISNGTSFAAPHVAGAAALLMQKANTTGGLSDALDHRVMKAILMNTTNKLIKDKAGDTWFSSPAYLDKTIVTDDQLGAGGLNAKQAYDNLVAGESHGTTQGDIGNGTVPSVPSKGWDKNSVSKGTSLFYHLPVLTGGQFLAATLIWDRPTGDAASNYAYDALPDLDLYLYQGMPGIGTPGTLLLNLSSISTNDNEELIFANLLATDFYTLEVQYHDLAGPASMDFGIAWLSNAIAPEPASLGLLSFAGLVALRRRRA
jgi:subtilase family protein